MTNKYIIFTDPHLGKQNHNKFWHDIVIKLFESIVKTCKKKNINKVICGGDFFDVRKTLNVLTIELARYVCQTYFEDEGIDLYIIRGNHDTYYKNLPDPHSLSILSHYKHVHIIDSDIFKLDNLYLVPWEANMESIPDNSFVIGHFEINGFVTNASGRIQSGGKLSASDFKRFKHVLSGHFHTPSIQNNIQYIGSAYPMDFNDVNSKRGYYIIEDEELQFIEFIEAPKFIKLTSEDEFTNIEGNIIKLIFVKDYGSVENEKILQKINDMNPATLLIDYQISEDEEIVMSDEDFDVNDNSYIMREYAKDTSVPENINKEMLIKFIDKLEQEEV